MLSGVLVLGSESRECGGSAEVQALKVGGERRWITGRFLIFVIAFILAVYRIRTRMSAGRTWTPSHPRPGTAALDIQQCSQPDPPLLSPDRRHRPRPAGHRSDNVAHSFVIVGRLSGQRDSHYPGLPDRELRSSFELVVVLR